MNMPPNPGACLSTWSRRSSWVCILVWPCRADWGTAAGAVCAAQAHTASTSTGMSKAVRSVRCERSELCFDAWQRAVDKQGSVPVSSPQISQQGDVVSTCDLEHGRAAVTAGDDLRGG